MQQWVAQDSSRLLPILKNIETIDELVCRRPLKSGRQQVRIVHAFAGRRKPKKLGNRSVLGFLL
jgi:hypothetical protein